MGPGPGVTAVLSTICPTSFTPCEPKYAVSSPHDGVICRWMEKLHSSTYGVREELSIIFRHCWHPSGTVDPVGGPGNGLGSSTLGTPVLRPVSDCGKANGQLPRADCCACT